MLRARGKKRTPVLMILALIAAVTPLPLRSMGVNMNVTPGLCSLLRTYGRAVSFVSWVYQPALVSQLNDLKNELPGDQPMSDPSPSCDQIACNQERITIEDQIIERPLPSTEIELQPMSQAEPITPEDATAPRLARFATKPRAISPKTLCAGEIIRVAMAQEIEIPQRFDIPTDLGAAFDVRFIAKPALLTQRVNDLSRQVKVALPVYSKEAAEAYYEAAIRNAQKLEAMKATCNFKGVKALQKKMLQEDEWVRSEKGVVKSQAKAASEPVESETLPEFMYSEF